MLASDKEIRCWISIAKEAALLAGSFLLKYNNTEILRETSHDVKIQADIESERIILDCLKEHSSFSVLSEESGLIARDGKSFIWIVDPLDGSLNYMRRIPLSCISIGLWQKESPLLGVVYDFNRSELFSGIVERGAWLNDRPIRISNVSQKEKAILCTGFPVNTDFSSKGLNAFTEEVRSYRKTRLLGSAALSIVYVACGKADAYCEKDIMLWDVAGAVPILLGSGGRLNMKRGAKLDSYYVYVSNGRF